MAVTKLKNGGKNLPLCRTNATQSISVLMGMISSQMTFIGSTVIGKAS
jgi:hypothetical protein